MILPDVVDCTTCEAVPGFRDCVDVGDAVVVVATTKLRPQIPVNQHKS